MREFTDNIQTKDNKEIGLLRAVDHNNMFNILEVIYSLLTRVQFSSMATPNVKNYVDYYTDFNLLC